MDITLSMGVPMITWIRPFSVAQYGPDIANKQNKWIRDAIEVLVPQWWGTLWNELTPVQQKERIEYAFNNEAGCPPQSNIIQYYPATVSKALNNFISHRTLAKPYLMAVINRFNDLDMKANNSWFKNFLNSVDRPDKFLTLMPGEKVTWNGLPIDPIAQYLGWQSVTIHPNDYADNIIWNRSPVTLISNIPVTFLKEAGIKFDDLAHLNNEQLNQFIEEVRPSYAAYHEEQRDAEKKRKKQAFIDKLVFAITAIISITTAINVLTSILPAASSSVGAAVDIGAEAGAKAALKSGVAPIIGAETGAKIAVKAVVPDTIANTVEKTTADTLKSTVPQLSTPTGKAVTDILSGENILASLGTAAAGFIATGLPDMMKKSTKEAEKKAQEPIEPTPALVPELAKKPKYTGLIIAGGVLAAGIIYLALRKD